MNENGVGEKSPEGSSRGWGILGRYVYSGACGPVLHIDRADPWSFLSAAEIGFLHEHPEACSPEVVLRCAGPGCPEGDVPTLSAVNRRVVYRLTEPLDGTTAWIMKWPD